MNEHPRDGAFGDDRQGFAGLRTLIQDLETDNIADLATRADSLEGVLRLWYGEGDVVTPPFIRHAAAEALEAGRTFYVPDMRGAADLVAALSAYQTSLFGKQIGEDRATVQPGGMQALFMAMSMVCDPGRKVVYVEPQWPNIRHTIYLTGCQPQSVALDLTGARPRLDLDQLFDACDEETVAICFSTPANPIGWSASKEELEAILAFARERGIWVISDEVYNRLWFGNEKSAPSMMAIAEPEDRVLTVNSFSKAWAMTGWRVGWLNHPSSVQKKLGAMTQYINSGTPGFVQAGAATALKEGEGLVAEIRERCRRGVDAAYEALSGVDAVHLFDKPLGGMYAFFRLKGEDDSRTACRRILEEARVGLAPGFMFGASANAWIRMCVCRDTKDVEEASRRIAEALR
ncbi:MAG: pyridoxal phosphate-dependent aminotransferase [Pseudomonadota bacterium]